MKKENIKKQPMEVFMRKLVKKLDKTVYSFQEAAEEWTKGTSVKIKDCGGYPYIYYQEDGVDKILYEDVKGNIVIGDEEPKAEEPKKPKKIELAKDSVVNTSTETLLSLERSLRKFGVNESKTLLSVVQAEIDKRRQKMKDVDPEKLVGTYWKIAHGGESYQYLKILEVTNILKGDFIADVIQKDPNCISYSDKHSLMNYTTIDPDGSLVGYTRITEEEYDKLRSIFD